MSLQILQSATKKMRMKQKVCTSSADIFANAYTEYLIMIDLVNTVFNFSFYSQ